METVTEVRACLRSLADPSIAEHSQRFFKTGKGEYGEGDRFLGIRVPVIRKHVRKHRALSIDETMLLLKSPFHEERLFAVLMLVHKFAQADEPARKEIYDLYLANSSSVNNWDLVDSSASQIVGQFLYDKDRRQLSVLARSDNIWHRRIAIMATFYFIRQNDFTDTLHLAALLLEDKEDLLHKAVGWMLREVGNRDMSAAEIFLRNHYKKMPRTMLRYAIEKFDSDKRMSYLQGRI
jgi:3-methyladenine DNA glycosylase AlkD